MAAANTLLKKTLPSTSGLEDTVLQQNMSIITIGEFVQFFHVSNNHWITISNRGQPPSTVCIYDSLLKKTSKATVKMIAHYCHSPEKNIRLNVMNVSRQPNTYDCGMYQGCGVERFFRIPTPDSDSSSFEKLTPTPAVLKNDWLPTPAFLKTRLRLQHFWKPDSDSSWKHATPPIPTPQP